MFYQSATVVRLSSWTNKFVKCTVYDGSYVDFDFKLNMHKFAVSLLRFLLYTHMCEMVCICSIMWCLSFGFEFSVRHFDHLSLCKLLIDTTSLAQSNRTAYSLYGKPSVLSYPCHVCARKPLKIDSTSMPFHAEMFEARPTDKSKKSKHVNGVNKQIFLCGIARCLLHIGFHPDRLSQRSVCVCILYIPFIYTFSRHELL